MLRFIRQLTIALGLILIASPPRAGFDLETAALPEAHFELVVVEVEGCVYCAVFRRDVLPSYEASQRAKSVPIRFIDISQTENGKLGLNEPVAQVPTVLLMKSGRETGRISGYVGPENFFHTINHMLSGAE